MTKIMKAKVYVTLKNGVLDPQGKAIQRALESSGFPGLKEVRVGKFFEIEAEGNIDKAALEKMADKLLANTVIENYKVEL